MANQPNQSNQTIYINFIAGVNEKTTSLLIYLLTEQLRAGTNSFRINISSPGGSVFQGISIYNFLKGLQDVSIHTHNLGQIDSVANVIFLAGQKRTASKATTFLFHPPVMNVLNAANFPIDLLEERLDSLKKDQQKLVEITAERINKNREDVMKMFSERKTLFSEEAKQLGLIDEIQDFVAAPGVPIFSITNQS